MTEDVLDGLFHACAWDAFLTLAHAQQGWPDQEATRRLAYRYYEEALAERCRNRFPSPARSATLPLRQEADTPHVL